MSRRRPAFLMLESLIALSVLATVSVLAVRMVQTRNSLRQAAADRLATQLQIENVCQRLSITTDDDLRETIESLDNEEVSIAATPFEVQSKQALQITVRSGTLTHTIWRIEP